MLYLYDSSGQHILTMDDARGVTIGRSDDNLLVLQDDYVSSKHAAIYCQNGRYFLQDLNSKNGTYMGQQRISNIELRDGGGFICGNVQLFVRIMGTPAQAKPIPVKNYNSGPAYQEPQRKASNKGFVAAIVVFCVLLLAGGAFLLLREKREPGSDYRYNGPGNSSSNKSWDGFGQKPLRGSQASPSGGYGNGPSPAANPSYGNGGGNSGESSSEGRSGGGNMASDTDNFGRNTYDIVKEGYKMQRDPVGTAHRLMEDDDYADEMEKKVDDYTESAERLNEDIEEAAEKAKNVLDSWFGD